MTACPSCGSDSLQPFYRVERVPVQSCVLLPSAEAALSYPTGTIDLAICSRCGFITNAAFDPDRVDYTQPYEESQEFSPRFMEFAEGLADELVARHDLRGKSVLDVGCGKASFLALLARRGIAKGFGIDPSVDPERIPVDVASTVSVDQRFFTDGTVGPTADLIICRHTLEHVQPVREFASHLVAARDRSPDAGLFIEVPDTQRILDERAFWDIYYEHCSYFTSQSLARLLVSVGGGAVDVRLAYGGQYLLATADGRKTASPSAGDMSSLLETAEAFSVAADLAVARWREYLSGRSQASAVLWGGGSKGTTFLNTIGDSATSVAAVVDINPHLQGTFVAGTGHRIVAPDELRQYRPETVIVMNPLYVEEITQALTSLGLSPAVVAVS